MAYLRAACSHLFITARQVSERLEKRRALAFKRAKSVAPQIRLSPGLPFIAARQTPERLEKRQALAFEMR